MFTNVWFKEIMEDCELSGSLRATSLDVAVSRSSALSLASVPDDTSNLNVPSSSSNHPSSHGQRLGNRRPSSSSRDERRRSDNMRDEVDRDLDDEREGRGVDLNRSLDDDRDDGHNVDDDDALGAIGGIRTACICSHRGLIYSNKIFESIFSNTFRYNRFVSFSIYYC